MASDQDRSLLAYFTSMENQGNTIVRDVPKLDLDSYISNYTGRTRFDRLLLIGQCSVLLCLDALKAALVEAKKGKDVGRYREAWNLLKQASPKEGDTDIDLEWISTTEAANAEQTRTLEAELKGYKNNLIKESIRIGHRELGQHLEATGKLVEAADAYSKMRSEATFQSHVFEVGRHIISIAIQRRDWTAVLTNTSKLVMTSSAPNEEINTQQPFQKIVSGLAYLGSGKYAEGAKAFLEVGELVNIGTFNDTVSPNDVATYGGLMALASMDRLELQKRVLDNPSFRTYLELEPHIRKAVTMFVNGRYTSCLKILESYRSDYLLDIHLQKHVDKIYSQIRSKCIVQYFLPFSCVTLDSMNEAFARPGENLEAELVEMIKSGVLKARINTIDKLLVSVSTEPRLAMQMKGLEAAKNYERETIERIRRMSIAAADLEVRGTRKANSSYGAIGSLGDIYTEGTTTMTTADGDAE